MYQQERMEFVDWNNKVENESRATSFTSKQAPVQKDPLNRVLGPFVLE